MKLEELLGEELFAQVKAKIDEANSKEPDKLKHIRYADLSEGEYVGKAKHEALETKYRSKEEELASANDLIAQLKKDTKGNEELQAKITTYEAENAKLQAELAETKLKSAIKLALLSEKAVDIDYLSYKLNEKLKEKGEILELDENDNIKGWDNQISGLKTQFPNMFAGAAADGAIEGFKPIDNSGLPKLTVEKAVTKDEFLHMSYEDRVKLKQENEQLYNKLAH